MSEDVVVTISDQTSPVSQEGFGLPLVFVNDTNISYKEVEGTDGLTTLTSGDNGYELVNAIFSQSPSPSTVAVYGVDVATAGTSISTELDELSIEHDDWYFLLSASRVQADLEESASWASANGKLFVGQNDIADPVSSVTTMAGNMNSEDAILIAHDGGTAGTDPYADGAIVGRIAPIQPGGTTWKFKQLSGIPVATYSNADVSTLDNANVNTIVKSGGIVQTSDGKTTSGGYADITRAKAWLDARITENIQFVLYNAEKIAYDDSGIAKVATPLKNTLKQATNRRVIARSVDGDKGLWSVDIPTRAEIPDNDKANRILPDMYFVVTIAGAVHTVQVNGVLQV